MQAYGLLLMKIFVFRIEVFCVNHQVFRILSGFIQDSFPGRCQCYQLRCLQSCWKIPGLDFRSK